MKYLKAALAISIVLFITILFSCTRQAVVTDKSEIDSYYAKANAFFEQKQIDSTEYYLNKCLAINRQYAPANYLMGKVYLYKDGIINRRLSSQSLREAIIVDNENALYHYSLGITYEKQGFYENALAEFQKAVKFDSTDSKSYGKIAEICNRFGLRYDDTKFFERSLVAAQKAAIFSNDPTQYYQQAVVLYEMGKFDSSAIAALECINKGADSAFTANSYMLIGTDLVRENKFDSANVAFEKGRSFLSQIARDEIDDVRYLMPPAEYLKLNEQSFFRQQIMIKQFWGQLDPDPTSEINERKLEHYSRFVHSQLNFSVPNKGIDGWKTKRGEMYIRYGPPTTQSYSLSSDGDNATSPKWIWVYKNQFDQPATFIFEDTFLNGNFDFPYPNKNWTFDDYDKDPARIAIALSGATPQVFDYQPGSGLLGYDYYPRQFKGSHGETDLEVFVAIPYKNLKFQREGESAYSYIHWRQALRYLNYNLSDTASTRKAYKIRASQINNASLSVADRLMISAMPDSLQFAISIKDTVSNFIGISNTEMRLRNFYTGKAEISDIVLARRIDKPIELQQYRRKDLNIVSNLDNRYFAGEPIWLYFEIYNLAKDSLGKTSYTINQIISERKVGGILTSIKNAMSGKELKEISTSYNGSSIYSDENRILSIDVSDFETGNYIIKIEINDLISGNNATASEEIIIYR